jgi:hypothetical protein
LVRETGSLANETMFPAGCPTDLGVLFLVWEAAIDGLRDVNRLPGPLRVRRAHDLGWMPGLWTASDHRAFAEQKTRRGLFARVGGK